MLRKKLLLIALLIVGGFAEEQEMGDLEKQMLYKQNDRSPLIAGLCALTPTMGHLYVNQFNSRLLTFTLPLGLLSYSLYSNGVTTKDKGWQTNDKKKIDEGRQKENFSLLPISIWYYLQLQDAIYLAYQHNADLYEEIYGKEYIRPPKKSIIQKIIDKKASKKEDERISP